VTDVQRVQRSQKQKEKHTAEKSWMRSSWISNHGRSRKKQKNNGKGIGAETTTDYLPLVAPLETA